MQALKKGIIGKKKRIIYLGLAQIQLEEGVTVEAGGVHFQQEQGEGLLEIVK